VNNIIFHLVSDVNILPKRTCEMMGDTKLLWSYVQLRFLNQHNIVSIGRLTCVPMNIYGVHNMVNFEFNEIVDDSQPYPTLMGSEQTFNN
jgi:hypothetical protein